MALASGGDSSLKGAESRCCGSEKDDTALGHEPKAVGTPEAMQDHQPLPSLGDGAAGAQVVKVDGLALRELLLDTFHLYMEDRE